MAVQHYIKVVYSSARKNVPIKHFLVLVPSHVPLFDTCFRSASHVNIGRVGLANLGRRRVFHELYNLPSL